MDPLRRTFPSMGTTVELIAAPGSDPQRFARAATRVERIFARENERFSRFRTDSELSRLNAQPGVPVRVSAPFLAVTNLALQAAQDTGGLFDPTVLPALKAAGYDRDYRQIVEAAEAESDDPDLRALRSDLRDATVKRVAPCGLWPDIRVRGNRVQLPHGAELDFGGIAKGWTVDRAAEALRGFEWAIVDAGGDLRVVGNTPGEGLDIGIEDPEARGAEALRVRLGSGALATTSVTVRSWAPGAHHVIDPRTSLPAVTGILQATVWAETCAKAEVWSKAAVLAGPVVFDHVNAALVHESGEIVTNFSDAGLTEVSA